MSDNIKILIVEDSPADAELLLRELKKAGTVFTSKIVQSRKEFENALDTFAPDLILSDFALPSFDGLTAFEIKMEKAPDTPFIIVSGTIGEENAVDLIKRGVTDYTLKGKLYGLVPRIARALKDTEDIKAKKIADEMLIIQNEKLMRSEAQIRNFAKHLNQVMEEERSNLAREIHDELGQQLAGIKLDLFSISQFSNGSAVIDEKVRNLMKEIDDTIQSLRKIATSLRPGILDALGLGPSIAWLVKEFEAKRNIICKLELSVLDGKFDEGISICFFRICQEALTNISKHTEATEVAVSLIQKEGELVLTLSDNGDGMESEKLANPFSMGLLGMRERANIINAELNISSKKKSGTTIELKLKVG